MIKMCASRSWLTGSTVNWRKSGSSSKTWRRTVMTDKCSRSYLVRSSHLEPEWNCLGYLTTSLLWSLLESRLQFLIPSFLFVTEKLSGRKLNVAEVTQSEIGQKQKLQTVLEAVNELLRPHGWTIEWSVECECCVLKPIRQQHVNISLHICTKSGCCPSAIHSKNLVAIVYLLVDLAMHFQAPIRLPEHVSVQVVVVKVSAAYTVSGSRSSAHFVFIGAETRGHPADRPRDERADEHHRVRAGGLASRCSSFTEAVSNHHTVFPCLFQNDDGEIWWVPVPFCSQAKPFESFSVLLYTLT